MIARIALSAIVALVIAAPLAHAEEPAASAAPAPEVQQALNPEQQKALIDATRELLRTLDSRSETGTAAPPTAAAPAKDNTKDMANVADRALTVFEKYGDQLVGLVAKAASTVEKAAPTIWRVMVVKQYATAFSDLVVPWGLFLAFIVYYFFAKKKWSLKENPRDDDRITYNLLVVAVPLIGGLCSLVWGLNRVSDTIKLLIVPEYYAFRDLLMLILKQQGL